VTYPATHLPPWETLNSPNYPHTRTSYIQLAPGTTRILDSAFHGNRAVQSVDIPASVATIGNYAFIGATGLRLIYNNDPDVVPQQINNTTFTGVTREDVTVLIPPGTTQAFLNAGWWGFRLIEIERDLSMTVTLNFYGRPDASVVLPVALRQAICSVTIADIATQVAGDGTDNNGGYAFLGWFTADQLDSSGRVRNGYRRPTIGNVGFDLSAVTTGGELIGPLINAAGNGNIELYAVWARWGDVNDDGMVNPQDANLLFQHVGGVYDAPVINLAPADVFRDGRVTPTDANVLFQHVGHVFGAPILGQGPGLISALSESIATWQISYEAVPPTPTTVSVRVELYENTDQGMGLTFLTLQYDSSLLSNPRVVPSLRLDRDRFEDVHYMFYDLLTSRGYTEAELVLSPIFSSVVVDDSSYHNNFIFDYVLYPDHIHGPDVILLRWNTASMRTQYFGADIFTYITFDVASGAQLSDRGAVWFNDGFQYMTWAIGAGTNQLALID